MGRHTILNGSPVDSCDCPNMYLLSSLFVLKDCMTNSINKLSQMLQDFQRTGDMMSQDISNLNDIWHKLLAPRASGMGHVIISFAENTSCELWAKCDAVFDSFYIKAFKGHFHRHISL